MKRRPGVQDGIVPLGNGVTEQDALAVNLLYNCATMKIKTGNGPFINLYVHPDWTSDFLKNEIIRRVVGSNPDTDTLILTNLKTAKDVGWRAITKASQVIEGASTVEFSYKTTTA